LRVTQVDECVLRLVPATRKTDNEHWRVVINHVEVAEGCQIRGGTYRR
jgi:hypothetical protein